MNRAPLSPLSALVAHLEPLIFERRILVIGNAERSLAEHLLERGARLVQVLDPDAKRVAHAAAHNTERKVTYAQLTDHSLREGSFDCALVENVELGESLDRLVMSVSRAMGSRGLAVFCCNNPESSTGLLGTNRGTVDYEALCDAAESQFEAVVTFGQSPFLGYSVVQFDLDHPPEPSLDNAYLAEQAETPDIFIALCGTEEVLADLPLEEMTIVQLPAARFVENSERIHRERELRASRHIETLEAELSELRARGSDKEVERLTAELNQRDSWIRQLESRAETADSRADDAEAEVEELEAELELTHKALKAERGERDKLLANQEKLSGDQERQRKSALDEVQKLTAKVQKLSSELDRSKREALEATHHSAGREALEGELNALDEKKRALEGSLEDKSRAFSRLEKRLAEQEREIDELHDQLDDTEATLDQLKTELNAREEPSTLDVERDLNALEEQLTERGRRILELEAQMKKLEIFAKTLSAELAAKEQKSNGQGTDPDELAALARALAEREADLVAAQWTIGQLKQSALKD